MPTEPTKSSSASTTPIVIPDLKDSGDGAKVGGGQPVSTTGDADLDAFVDQVSRPGDRVVIIQQSPRADANQMVPKKRGVWGKIAAAAAAIGIGIALMFGIGNIQDTQQLPLNPPAIEQPGDLVPITPGQGPPPNGTVIPAEPATPPPNNNSIPPATNNGNRIPQIEIGPNGQIKLPDLKN